MIHTLQLLSPRVAAALLFLVVLVGFLWRVVFGTWFGALLFAMAVYYWASCTGTVVPYTLPEMALWMDKLEPELKSAVTTSILTILGFLIAFRAAAITWKEESAGQLRIALANEVEQFFDDVNQQLLTMRVFANGLLETERTLNADGLNSPRALFHVEYTVKKIPDFLVARDRLSQLTIEIHRIPGRHSSTLSLLFSGPRLFEEASKAVRSISETMWFRFPMLKIDDPNLVENFMRQVAPDETTRFLNSVEQLSPYLFGVTGGLRGLLVAPIIGFNFAALLNLCSQHKLLVEAFGVVRSQRRRNNSG